MKAVPVMLFLVLGLGLSAAAARAHEGEAHREEAAPPLPPLALAERPHRLDDGSLYVPKAAQHLLGIRTLAWTGVATRIVSLPAEVQAQPAAAVAFTAAEPGRLEPEGAWPLPGRAVKAGQLLAWLRPTISQRDAARRRADVADLDQKLIIANLNVERLSLQGAVNGDQKVATGNIYLEEAVAQRDALQRQRELIAESLAERVPLRAPVGGTVLAVPARAGDVVAAGQLLFQFSDPNRLRLSALVYDPTLGARLHAASLRLPDGDVAELAYRGQEPLATAPGWRLAFDLDDGDDLMPGQVVRLDAQVQGATLPGGACAVDGSGAPVVWLHNAPERFVPLHPATCDVAVALRQGDRLVVQGAGLLAQYR